MAVGPDDDAVLVVAVLLGAQPDRALGVVDVAELAQSCEGTVGGAGLVEVVLVEPHVERHPEVAQRLLDLLEHQPDAGRPEGLQRLVVGQPGRLGMGGHDLLGDLGDVLPGIAVLRRRLVPARGEQRPAEPVDLGAVVVEVVLAGDDVAGRLEQPRERVADRRPPGAGQGDRAGRVGRDELDVHLLLLARLGAAVRRAGGDDVVGDLALRSGVDADVEEARTGHLDAGDAVGPLQPCGHQPREVTRGLAGLLGELERDVGGVVAVALLPRALHGDRLGQAAGQRDRALRGEVRQGGDDQVGELLGVHRARVSAPAGRPRPTSACRISAPPGRAPRRFPPPPGPPVWSSPPEPP